MPHEISWEAPALGTRKRMRKGTRSCFECRRRKIRCVFPTAQPSVCTQCSAHGARCINQEHAETALIPDRRKNLRQRVTELEALIESLTKDQPDRGLEQQGGSPGSSGLSTHRTSEPLLPSEAVHASTYSDAQVSLRPPAESAVPHPAAGSFASSPLNLRPRLNASTPSPGPRTTKTRNPGRPHLIDIDFHGVEITPPASRAKSGPLNSGASTPTPMDNSGGIAAANRNPGPPHLINVDFSSLQPPSSDPPPSSPVTSTEASMTQEFGIRAHQHQAPASPDQDRFRWHGGYACGMLY
ncbi:hypothetical protein W97_05041 [Coniosporium apollinis CBS 100218]|uniref:Zn(2)-C6 fungal-type domain-containing protein n=1 Tax=Coniosporium apollinis (strain CBS 100218) TaxID=1168221 RepID=R7YV67_CONA1|nr:uncharacterized protein W97_05041 [Coniosporium apollinis CBS 100218]EON65802.1 hypothetical protein W97_05041 [Coniosporium apollinis CBS 100218]